MQKGKSETNLRLGLEIQAEFEKKMMEIYQVKVSKVQNQELILWKSGF